MANVRVLALAHSACGGDITAELVERSVGDALDRLRRDDPVWGRKVVVLKQNISYAEVTPPGGIDFQFKPQIAVNG